MPCHLLLSYGTRNGSTYMGHDSYTAEVPRFRRLLTCDAALHLLRTGAAFIISYRRPEYESWKCVIPVVCVKIGKGMQSNTTMPIKVYLMAILDNYMFRPLLAVFTLSSRELKVLLYTLSTHVVQRSLRTGLDTSH